MNAQVVFFGHTPASEIVEWGCQQHLVHRPETPPMTSHQVVRFLANSARQRWRAKVKQQRKNRRSHVQAH